MVSQIQIQGWTNVDGREDAFERLFHAEYGRVAAIACRVLGDAHLAEDVAQDVFCQFYRVHHPDAPYARPWLYRAATHAALNVIRGNKRRLRRETSVALEGERRAAQGGRDLDPLHAVEQAEGAQELRTALSRLPRKQASILVLRYSGLTYAEIASTLDITTGQIGTLLRRAEAALRKELTRATSLPR